MAVKVLNGGFLTTVQDLGRIGYQQFGVPVSGVADQRSFLLGNALVGNEDNEAGLEITMMGPTLIFECDCVIALTGGDLSPQLEGAPCPMYRAVAVKAGETLSFAMQRTGCRSYLAFAGGLALEPVMGSRSTYLKAKLGGYEGRQLKPGDCLALRDSKTTLPNLPNRAVDPEDFSAAQKTLRVVMGPQEDAFTEAGVKTFLGSVYAVGSQFDRMGCRLEGDKIEHVTDANIISDGIAFGAVQVPGEGTPIIMMCDRQTTGGYTKIATVATVDLPLIAQCKTGDSLRFAAIGVEEAQTLYRAWLERLAALRVSLEMSPAAAPVPVPPPRPAAAPVPVPPAAAACRHYTIKVEGVRYDVTVEPIN